MPKFAKDRRIDLEARLRPLIEEEQLQQHAAAERLGVSLAWVERACKRLGLKTQRTGPRGGEGHPNWKGGRHLVGGYWYVWAPDHPAKTEAGYVAEHRIVAERLLGRLLRRVEVVHHIDGDPKNNAPENLQVFSSNADHLRHELKGRIPNWSEEGRKKTLEGVRRGNATRHQPKSDDGPQPQTTGHPT
jgi:HNH endonuclease